jgi:apolipoprotein N-acyltransferase
MSRQSIRIVRSVALSGAALAALGIATPAVAAAAEHTSTVQSVQAATDTTVRLADGTRTMTVRGLPTTHYAASADHSDAVITVAAVQPSVAPAIDANVTPAVDQVTPASVSGGTIGAGLVGLMLIGVVVFIGIKGRKVAPGWAITLVALGVLLDGTFVGPLIKQLTTSVVTAAASTLGNL